MLFRSQAPSGQRLATMYCPTACTCGRPKTGAESNDGGIAADPSLGGALEFLDPRGAGPVMYAPHLGFAMKGGLSGGANEVLQPKAGRMVLFPSWLLHQVRHYRGTAERISIAFNLNL